MNSKRNVRVHRKSGAVLRDERVQRRSKRNTANENVRVPALPRKYVIALGAAVVITVIWISFLLYGTAELIRWLFW